jgi:ribose-phosphate pyrophosphokinase
MYKTAGADRIMSVDLHTSQIQGFFDGPVDHLMAIPLLADYIRTRVSADNITVVSPDTGRVRVAEQWAERLGGAPLAFVHKSRDLTVPNQAVSKTVVGQIEGRTCVLIDDMIDTGGTISGAVQVLKNAGAKDVIIAATHAVFSDPAGRRLSESGAAKWWSPTRCPSLRTSVSPSSPCCPSRRSSPGPSGKCLTTDRSPASSTATPNGAVCGWAHAGRVPWASLRA